MKVEEAFQQPADRLLANAAACGDSSGMQSAVQAGANLNTVGKNGLTHLTWALAAKNKEGMKELLEMGANPNQTPMTVLMAAELAEPKLLELLLQHGANPNVYNQERTITPLHRAIMSYSQDSIEVLLKYGADLNAQDKAGYTPVLVAAELNRYDYVLFLLNRGADYKLEAKGKNGSLKYLLERSLVDPSSDGYKARIEVVKMLKEKGIDVKLKNP